jgi:glycosyltransferase involved in cell wall biosynthesis
MKFSIIITCYNQRRFIRDAVDTALSQSYPDKEVIVIDDGSTDGSVEILQQYGDAITLQALDRNSGAPVARNLGASIAKGSYLAFVDGDDALLPWALDVYARMIAERSPKIIVGGLLYFEGPVPLEKGKNLPREIRFVEYDSLLAKDRTFVLCTSSFVVARRSFQEAGGWTPHIFHMDDVDLFLKLGCSGRTILIGSPSIAFRREHEGNSMNTIPPFLRMNRHLIEKERAGQFPGGRERRFERHAWLGGVSAYWIRKALRAGLYKDALRLALPSFSMVAAWLAKRAVDRICGRRPVEVLDFSAPLVAPCTSSQVISSYGNCVQKSV